MSLRALTHILESDIRPSTRKFVAVVMANFANDEGCCYPSIETLCRLTACDRKTVMKSISELVKLGVIKDTGQRKGVTGRVRVFRLREFTSLNSPNLMTNHESAIVPYTDNQSCRIGTINRAVYGTQILKVHEIDTKEGKVVKKLPDKFNNPEFKQALENFTQMRKEINKNLTPAASSRIVEHLTVLDNIDAIKCLEASTANSWQGVFPDRFLTRYRPVSGSRPVGTNHSDMRGVL